MKLGVLYISGRHGAGLWVIVEHAEWRQSNVISCTAQHHLKDSTLGMEVPSLSDGRSQTKTMLSKATLQFGHWSCTMDGQPSWSRHIYHLRFNGTYPPLSPPSTVPNGSTANLTWSLSLVGTWLVKLSTLSLPAKTTSALQKHEKVSNDCNKRRPRTYRCLRHAVKIDFWIKQSKRG